MKDTTKQLEQITKACERGHSLNLAKVGADVLELQTADKFRLVASLLEFGRIELAEVVAKRAHQEIELVLLFGKKSDERRS